MDCLCFTPATDASALIRTTLRLGLRAKTLKTCGTGAVENANTSPPLTDQNLTGTPELSAQIFSTYFGGDSHMEVGVTRLLTVPI
jgi:hypothetical protein